LAESILNILHFPGAARPVMDSVPIHSQPDKL